MGFSKDIFLDMQQEIIDRINDVDNGNTEIIPVLIELEQYRKLLDDTTAIIKSFKDENVQNIQSNAIDYQNEYGGYKIEVRSGGRMYNYKMIEDWQECNQALKDCEARSKQALLSKEKGMMVATEEGEEIQLPEISYRKDSVIIKKL